MVIFRECPARLRRGIRGKFVFTKSLKRVKQWKRFRSEKLREVIRLLAHREVMPSQYRDHALVGSMLGFRECYIAPDILLIYEVSGTTITLTLIDIGNHAQLFK